MKNEIVFLFYKYVISESLMSGKSIKKSLSHEMILALNDFRDVYENSEFMTQVRKRSKELFDEKSLKLAAIGVNGIKRILVNAYNIFATKKVDVFDTKEEDFEYLVK